MTYGIKLKKLLSRQGIASRQVKDVKKDGCNHGVEIDRQNLYAAIAILREKDIAYWLDNGKNDLP